MHSFAAHGARTDRRPPVRRLRPRHIAWSSAATVAASAVVFAGTHTARLVAWWETGRWDQGGVAAHPQSTGETAPGGGALELPELIGAFRAVEPTPTRGPDFVRRTYARGADRVTVTVARLDLGTGGYARWLHQSREGYPQADLGLLQTQGNGFYECSDDAMTRCNLLIQMQSGVHIEIRAEGGASRADVDAIATGLRLTEL